MKNIGLKITASILTFFAGIGLVSVFKAPDYTYLLQPVSVQIPRQSFALSQNAKQSALTSPDGKVEIQFIKFSATDGSLTAEFQVTNYNTRSTSYWAYSDNQDSELGSPNPHFKINEIHQEVGYCGTGLEEFELKAGESKFFQVSGHQLNDFIGKSKKDIQVGYWFSTNNKDGKLIWSEKFQISDSILKQLKVEEAEIEKRNR